MPRDDLSIDFAPRMAQSEKWDASMVLDEWALRVENLPHEIAFMQEEIAEKDRRMQDCMAIITKCDFQIQKWIRQHGSHVPNPKQDALDRQVTQNFDKAQIIQAEKVALAEKTKIIMDKHTRWLDTHIKYLVDKGELQVEANFPSTLNASNNDTAVASSVLAPINNVAPVANARHPNQYPQRQNLHAQVLQTSAALSASTSAATPNASQPGRNAREMSSGAGNANKRQKMLGGIPLQTSGLSRQASNTPGTPRGATPVSGVRAGSTGPRSSQTATKKVISHGNKPTGPPRKHKKSTLNRVKGVRNKNSPSSTNDSELSDAESGSVDDDDAHTPAGNRDGDEEMGDPDEENGEGDDKVYCICQKVSFGDMVACDNENCEYEWFHWNCVGVKAEPPGSWICPPCTRSGFRK